MTAAIALARTLYPLSSVPDAVMEGWYGWASVVAATVPAARRQQAFAHLLGHVGEVWARSTAGGVATGGGSGSAGSITASRSSTLSVSFGSAAGIGAWVPPTAQSADLAQTPGGRAYLSLMAATPEVSAPLVV